MVTCTKGHVVPVVAIRGSRPDKDPLCPGRLIRRLSDRLAWIFTSRQNLHGVEATGGGDTGLTQLQEVTRVEGGREGQKGVSESGIS